MPREIFGSKTPGPEAAKGKVDRRFLPRSGRIPIEKCFCTRQQDAAEKRRGLLLLILSTTSYCLVKLVCWDREGGNVFGSPENFDSSGF